MHVLAKIHEPKKKKSTNVGALLASNGLSANPLSKCSQLLSNFVHMVALGMMGQASVTDNVVMLGHLHLLYCQLLFLKSLPLPALPVGIDQAIMHTKWGALQSIKLSSQLPLTGWPSPTARTPLFARTP